MNVSDVAGNAQLHNRFSEENVRKIDRYLIQQIVGHQFLRRHVIVLRALDERFQVVRGSFNSLG